MSKLTLSVILGLLTYCLHCEDSDRGWTSSIKKDTDVTTGKIDGLVIQCDIVKEHRVVTIKNGSLAEISYNGYGDQPRTFTRVKSDGAWKDGGWAWCGTGAADRILKPEQQVVVTLGKDDGSQIFAIFRKDGKNTLIKLTNNE